MEYEKSEYQANTEKKYDEGYSEKEAALDSEVRSGDLKSLKKFNVFDPNSRLQKILEQYQLVSNEVNQRVVAYYEAVIHQEKKAEKLFQEIQVLRISQDILLNCLLWETKGQLDESMVPGDIWKLIA